ncbi:MAG: PsiF family protein, partial [Betaproteobacteria bacterium]
KQAGEKKLSGDERKQFMSQCLSAAGVPAAKGEHKTTQQEKRAACNMQPGAKALQGHELKPDMSNCRSGCADERLSG